MYLRDYTFRVSTRLHRYAYSWTYNRYTRAWRRGCHRTASLNSFAAANYVRELRTIRVRFKRLEEALDIYISRKALSILRQCSIEWSFLANPCTSRISREGQVILLDCTRVDCVYVTMNYVRWQRGMYRRVRDLKFPEKKLRIPRVDIARFRRRSESIGAVQRDWI